MTASKTSAISRRQLLRGDLAGARSPIRPPWALSEEIFLAACDRCSDCIYACPDRVIGFGAGGFPEMDFSERGCSLCGQCVTACGGKALTGDPARDRPWYLTVEIAESCLAKKGVVCRSCGEACDEGAIRFRLRVGGAAEPRLDRAACTCCGSCIGVCPVKALSIRKLNPGNDLAAASEMSAA